MFNIVKKLKEKVNNKKNNDGANDMTDENAQQECTNKNAI